MRCNEINRSHLSYTEQLRRLEERKKELLAVKEAGLPFKDILKDAVKKRKEK